MSSVSDLKLVLKEALENNGSLNEIKSKLRAEIFNILDDNCVEKPRISQENLLINELIREYMDYNSLKYSKSVFLKETNQPNEALNREIIAAELHIKEDKTTLQVPLIYSILWNFLNKNDDESALPNDDFINKGFQNKNDSTNQKTNMKQQKSNKNISIYKFQEDQFD